MSLLAKLTDIYEGRATRAYGLTDVHQLAHALQSAELAAEAGESPALILAALLHDVGHMVHELGEDPARAGVDDRHEDLGADWLAQHFPRQVSEPVRLHVAAKRYLCATEPGYTELLSEDSIRSLALQGGPMSAEECTDFRTRPFVEEALRLRRYDDAAKDPNRQTRRFGEFMAAYGALFLRIAAPPLAV
ncbi:hypothetical protein VZ95_06285 [Elstera litoralis]|uniref:HD domain-containing protein n=1 Tax=Elstera litoralis TaxID=552518 RepID=A0A0F3IXC5_9PROT|nr:HD domain-containing protein [Elstera litoralis]KJV10244.1 hypothetical protein VZ95_06285 [Elstera litoralis]